MPRGEPHAGVALLVFKLRTGGLSWLFDRLKREWQMPTTRLGRSLYRGARPLSRRRRRIGGAPTGTLYAFYDLGIAPITFDFLWFLAGAEIERRRLALPTIHVIIVPGREEGLRREREDYDRAIDAQERRRRIDSILMPAAALLPTVAGVAAAATRLEAEEIRWKAGQSVFPPKYEIGAPLYTGALFCLAAPADTPIASLRAVASDLKTIDEWLAAHGAHGRVVTITLRGYRYMPARNSNLTAWSTFARRLTSEGYWPVVIPDTDQVIGGLPAELEGLTVATEAAINVRLRMALYERAWLNLGVNGGPMGLCWLNERTRYITFKILTQGVPQASASYVASHGFALGKSLPFATAFQKWVWEDDDLPVIEREFEKMARLIDERTSALEKPRATA